MTAIHCELYDYDLMDQCPLGDPDSEVDRCEDCKHYIEDEIKLIGEIKGYSSKAEEGGGGDG